MGHEPWSCRQQRYELTKKIHPSIKCFTRATTFTKAKCVVRRYFHPYAWIWQKRKRKYYVHIVAALMMQRRIFAFSTSSVFDVFLLLIIHVTQRSNFFVLMLKWPSGGKSTRMTVMRYNISDKAYAILFLIFCGVSRCICVKIFLRIMARILPHNEFCVLCKYEWKKALRHTC